MSITQLVRGVLPLERDRSEGEQQGTEESKRQETSHRTTQLFRCDPCNATYIDEEMESCPECDDSVETVPSEQDLGFV